MNKFFFIYMIMFTVLIFIFFKNRFKAKIDQENFDQSLKKDNYTIIVHTKKSKSYANKICEKINNNCFTTDTQNLQNTYKLIKKKNVKNKNIIIHPRTATPLNTVWINYLKTLESNGVKVINPPKLLQLTSNKLECSLVLYNNGISHPETWKGLKNNKSVITIKNLLKNQSKLIIKPSNSISQGAYVQIIYNYDNEDTILQKINSIPTDIYVIQEYVDYIALYRVIVIGGKSLPFTYMDVPTEKNWKVSVCLNNNMKFIYKADKILLKLAEDTQSVLNNYVKNPFKGIHFIDIFKTKNNKFVISEINTACSLLIHERLAKDANHPMWNISKYIADYLKSI